MNLSLPIRPESVETASRYLAIAAFGALIFLLWECFFHSAEKDFQKMTADFSRHAGASRHSDPPTIFGGEESQSGILRSAQDDGRRAQDDASALAAYEAAVSGKSLFQFSSMKTTPAAGGQNTEPNVLQDVALVGLLPGEVPQAILENRKTQKTHYLSPGQSSNGITVEEIRGQRVTVSAGSEKKTLTL